MPLHDWSAVEAGIFHDFHTAWITEIRASLNSGLLPRGYYALAEQHAGQFVAEILTLREPDAQSDADVGSESAAGWTSGGGGGLAVAEAPPRVRLRQSAEFDVRRLDRTLAIRHVSRHQTVAVLEIVSPANKDREGHLSEFVSKTVSAIRQGVHVLIVDLFAAGPHDPDGIHPLIMERVLDNDAPPVSLRRPRSTLVSYVSHEKKVDAWLEHLDALTPIPDMPIFLTTERYVSVPLEETYQQAWTGMPAFWRNAVEKASVAGDKPMRLNHPEAPGA